MKEVWVAFGLTVFAGMATGIGSAIAFTARRTNYRFLSISTGFSAGVMLYVSFVEIFYKGVAALAETYGEYLAHWINAASFFGGMLLIGVIDNLIPSAENPHETHAEKEIVPLRDPSAALPDFDAVAQAGQEAAPGVHDHGGRERKLLRMGLFTALAIAIPSVALKLAFSRRSESGDRWPISRHQATVSRSRSTGMNSSVFGNSASIAPRRARFACWLAGWSSS